MDFLIDKFYKFKNYIILILILFALIIINDFIMFNFMKSNKENINSDGSVIADTLIDNLDVDEGEEVSVDVKGYVKKPNVYKLSSASNVLDAINMAGGLKKNADTFNINLSKKLKDEMVIYVDKKQSNKNEDAITSVSSNNQNSNNVLNDVSYDLSETPVINASDNLVNFSRLISINNATVAELSTISGIGESKAEAIVKYRSTNRFNDIKDILNVPGIGEALFDKIKDQITL